MKTNCFTNDKSEYRLKVIEGITRTCLLERGIVGRATEEGINQNVMAYRVLEQTKACVACARMEHLPFAPNYHHH